MRILNRFWAIFVIAFKRILSQPGMALATVVGMVFAISLSMSVPLYASSVYNSIFLQRVGYSGDATARSNYPPFTFLFTYDSNIHGNLQWEDMLKVNDYLKNQAQAVLGLPIKAYTRYFATNPLAMFPANVKQFASDQEPLIWSSFAMMDNIKEHVTVAEGTYPQVKSDGPIEVMIYSDLATELGLQVGEEYTLFAKNQVVNGTKTTLSIPIKITGIFIANNASEEYWFIKPQMLKERLIVPEETFVQRVSPLLNDEIYASFWYLGVDGSSVKSDQSLTMIYRIGNLQREADQRLSRIKLSVSPKDDLIAYQRSANLLTVLLFAFSVPIFGLLLAFVIMIASMTVERQRNEIAVLRSRGAMIAQMLGIATVESLLLGAVALAIGLPVAGGIAWLIGRTRSFLDFSSPESIPLVWSANTLYFGLGAILLTMLARLLPTIGAARSNIIIYKRERARNLRAPLWQRMGLDVLLLIPAGYGLYQLRQAGSIDMLGASVKGDPFTNPLLIMVPALAIFASSLFFLRLMPFFMRLIAWITAHTRSVGLMMAARHLARTPGTYTMPLVLLILTLSLSAFTATLAGTLDHHLREQIYYRIGADATFTDIGDSPESSNAGTVIIAAGTKTDNGFGSNEPDPSGWFFLPVTDYLKLPGVTDATRVGRYNATAVLGSQYAPGQMLGVDRYNLPNIAFWRPDFARDSLGELMNRLAATPDGVLVNDAFWGNHQINQNDLITISVSSNQQRAVNIDFHVVGYFHLFPTYYPSDQSLFVANLDYLFEALGGEYPYEVWLKTSGPINTTALMDEATKNIGARTMNWDEPASQIENEQSRPERQGLFGVLSVGFGAAALLTVLGFLLYALLSYQRRFVELGVLRAVGLSTNQMIIFLASELAFLILMGGLIGTVLGVWVSNNFIPYLQIGAEAQAKIPPYVVYIAWLAILRVYALFCLLFIAALTFLMVMLRRMKIFQAIKMGETT